MKTLGFIEREEIGPAVETAVEVVRAGGVVLIPTESYYGLAADPTSAGGVERVLHLKGRPDDLGLPVVCSDWDQVDGLVRIPDEHRVKLSRLWPAALSVIASGTSRWPAARGETLAVRIPDLDALRALLYRTGPLTATSANRHGEGPFVAAAEALDSLAGAPDLVLDGGILPGGRVSTMVDLGVEGGRVVRTGAVGWEQHLDPETWVLSDS